MKNQVRKSILAGILSLVLAISGFLCVQNREVQASDATNTDSRAYHAVTYSEFEKYIDEKTAPVKDGYLFAGWVTTGGQAIDGKDDSDINSAKDNITAKFIPANLAGVACQVKANTYDDGIDSTELRIVSVVDGGTYQEFGYNLYKRVLKDGTTDEYVETPLCVYDKTGETENPSKTIDRYSGLYVYTSSTEKTVKSPADIFGAEAEGFYFTTVKIGSIPSRVYDSCIFAIRPYWVTADGTYVEGLCEFDRVSDGKNGIANISVNIKEAEAIAAGMMSVQYETANYEFVGADYGRVFDEMEIKNTDGKVNCVGNVSDISDNASNPNDVYVNLRFKIVTQNLTKGTSVFKILKPEFCDYSENFTSAKVWDVKF